MKTLKQFINESEYDPLPVHMQHLEKALGHYKNARAARQMSGETTDPSMKQIYHDLQHEELAKHHTHMQKYHVTSLMHDEEANDRMAKQHQSRRNWHKNLIGKKP